ncbi:MAG: sugar phosphate isomerase/epimerase family protein [Brevibacterium sp.]
MNRLTSLHAPSLRGASTVELITAAASSGFDACGIRMIAPPGIDNHENLVADSRARAQVRAALDRTQIRILDVELFQLGTETTDWRPLISAAAEIGAENILAVAFDGVNEAITDSLQRLAEQCVEFGIGLGIEPITYSAIPDAICALEIVQEIDLPINIVIDALQFFRSGLAVDDLAAIPASRIPYVQLCDAPLKGPTDAAGRRHEARSARLSPGRGELPLQNLLSALPSAVPISVEVPNSSCTPSHYDRARQLALDLDRLLS